MTRFHTISHRIDLYERTLVLTLVAAITCTAIAYVYFLSVSVFSVVERNQAERSIENVRARVADAERDYARVGQSITLALATKKGFHVVNDPVYLAPDLTPTTITMRDH